MANARRSRLKRLELKLRVDQRSVEKENREWLDQRITVVRLWHRLVGEDLDLGEVRKTFSEVMENANAEGRIIPRTRGPSEEWREWIDKQHESRQAGGPSIPEPWGNDSYG